MTETWFGACCGSVNAGTITTNGTELVIYAGSDYAFNNAPVPLPPQHVCWRCGWLGALPADGACPACSHGGSWQLTGSHTPGRSA